MIYILTPFLQDFKLTCEENSLPYENGHSRPDVVFVDNVYKLFGRSISKHDKVILGKQYDAFSRETINRINTEIAIRMEK